MSKFINKIKEVGLTNTIIGTIKREKYKRLQKKYNFYDWHISPYELRGYAQAVAKYINNDSNVDNMIIDLGCGMGEVITHIKHPNRVGYDPDHLIIDVASDLYKKNGVEFKYGTFDELCSDYEENTPISYLLTLGFMQGSTEDKWVDYYHKVLSRFNVNHVVIDTLKEGVNGAHRLDFTKILPSNYVLAERMGPFLGERYVEIYTKQ